MDELYKLQDEDGNIHNTVVHPAVVFDTDTGTIHRIGEKENMEKYFEKVQAQYRKHQFYEEADAIVLMDLPKDQEIIDKVFQITGYVNILYRKICRDTKEQDN